jgi:hypothetical protein
LKNSSQKGIVVRQMDGNITNTYAENRRKAGITEQAKLVGNQTTATVRPEASRWS